MTEEQAVAWLLLEGFVTCYDRGPSRWWLRPGPESFAIKYVGSYQLTAYTWHTDEFEHVDSPANYPQHAIEVVKLIMEHNL